MKNLKRPGVRAAFRKVPAVIALLLLSSCSAVTEDPLGVTGLEKVADISGVAAPDAAYTLEILHVNDVHSNIDPVRVSLRTEDGRTLRTAAGGPEALVSVIEARRKANPRLVMISAGDQITGNAANFDLFHGEADAVLHGIFRDDFYVLGNHEFDHGGNGIAAFVSYMRKHAPQAVFLNSDLSVGPQSPMKDTGVRSALREIGGRNVAFYGVTTPKKIERSSSPDPDMTFTPAVETVNRLSADNSSRADIHVLVSHEGIEEDVRNAGKYEDIDIIVGGDSHSLCGGFREFGLDGGCGYPAVLENASGHRICMVQANEYGKVIGDLLVSFDGEGNVISCAGRPFMPLDARHAYFTDGGSEPGDPEAVRAALDLIADERSPFILSMPEKSVTERLGPWRRKIAEHDALLGTATEDLCSTRQPAETCLIRNAPVPGGSEVCRAFGEMYLSASGSGASIFLGNSGGFRTDVERGAFTENSLLGVTPFRNHIVLVRLTGRELVSLLSHAMSYISADIESRDGGIPCGSGFSYAMDLPGGSASDVRIRLSDGTYAPADPAAVYDVLVPDYIMRGKDGYDALAEKKPVSDFGIDADLVRKYLKEHGSLPQLSGAPVISSSGG